MHIGIGVNKKPPKGTTEFFKELPQLMKAAATWTIVSCSSSEATIRSTATMTSVPTPPTFKLRETSAGGISASLVDTGWSHEQQALALGPLVYLFLTALSSFTGTIEISS